MLKKKKIYILAAVLAVAAVACALVFGMLWTDHRASNFSRGQDLYIWPDTPVQQVFTSLVDSGVVIRPASLKRALKHEGLWDGEAKMKPGHYKVDGKVSSYYFARMLANGWQTPVRLTIAGTVRTKDAIASRISRQMMTDSVSVMRALNDSVLLSSFGFTPTNVFSMIIPDTYEVYWTSPPDSIFSVFNRAWKKFWTPENDAKAKALGLSRLEVSTLASIVSGETRYKPEMPSIAGVYLNRLRIGMLLQADPTVAYCFGYKPNRILLRHLEVDSPYNTYKYAGLPPGPICSPPRECLEAVLNPDRNGYLYFCASPALDGTHRFSSTYPGHLANAREFQKALNARNK